MRVVSGVTQLNWLIIFTAQLSCWLTGCEILEASNILISFLCCILFIKKTLKQAIWNGDRITVVAVLKMYSFCHVVLYHKTRAWLASLMNKLMKSIWSGEFAAFDLESLLSAGSPHSATNQGRVLCAWCLHWLQQILVSAKNDPCGHKKAW